MQVHSGYDGQSTLRLAFAWRHAIAWRDANAKRIQRGTNIMARIGVIIMALAIVGAATSGDFPAPGKLPLKADLPDPLVMFNGDKVKTWDEWRLGRRPELKRLFEHYMYGKAPKAPKVNAKVERIDPKALAGKATLKEITLTLQGIDGPKIHLLLVIPNKG